MPARADGVPGLFLTGATLMGVAVFLNLTVFFDQLFARTGGLVLFFAGGVMTASALCRPGSDPERWSRPLSLGLTLAGVLLLAAAQFEDERKTVASYAVLSLRGDVEDARLLKAGLRDRYGGADDGVEATFFRLNAEIVADAYEMMSRYCVTDIDTLVLEVEMAPRIEVEPAPPGYDPAEDLSAKLEAIAEAQARQGRGCAGAGLVADWVAAELPAAQAGLAAALRGGGADGAAARALIALTPQVYRHLYALPAYQERATEVPSFAMLRPAQDDLAAWRRVTARLPGLEAALAAAEARLAALAGAEEDGWVLFARTLNLSIWTFALVLAVSVDTAVWLHGRRSGPVAPAEAGEEGREVG